MAFLSDFVERPQATAFRKTVFQIHLWTGLALGLYGVAIGITGSVLVFEPELQARTFPQLHAPAGADGPRADPSEVFRAVEAAYPGYRVSSLNWPSPQRNSFVAYPSRGGNTRTVFAHPHTGAVVGELPRTGWLRWTWELHVYLLAGGAGLRANGLLAGGLLVLAASGLVVWWPGRARWKRALAIDVSRGWRRIVFDLHSALGIWTVAFLALWSISGVYLTFPQPFRSVVAAISPLTVRAALPRSAPADGSPEPAALIERALAAVPGSTPARYTRAARPDDPIVVLVARDAPGDRIAADEFSVYFDRYSGALLEVRPERGTTTGDLLMVWLFPLHAGWFGGTAVKVLWAMLGLAPATLFVTGAIMWWKRIT